MMKFKEIKRKKVVKFLTLLCCALLFYFNASSIFAMQQEKNNIADPVEVPVKVTITKANWVDTISVCNISSGTVPLTNVQFSFNYSVKMPTNIWGSPWLEWKVASQTGTAVVLKGGTPWTPPLPPDPSCQSPITIQFSASPDTPAATGPFVFKAEGAKPSGSGALTINLGAAPATNLPLPTLSVTGPNTSQQKIVAWSSSWQLTNLASGNYKISASPVNNGTNYYTADDVPVVVTDQKTTVAQITYKAVVMGNVQVNLVSTPTTQVPMTFTGAKYTINKTVSHGMTLQLPSDTYTISSIISGYNTSITPNPITVPGVTSITATYTPIGNTSGPYTTLNGQIVDNNRTPVTFQGVNWFGFNTDVHVVHGLWTSDFDTMLNQIKSCGFNAVRIPFQFDFIFDASIKPSSITTTCDGKPCNQNIPKDSALSAFQWVVKRFTDSGLYVLLDDHYEDLTYVNNQARWIAGWQKVAQMFINNPSVGYDLYNEPDAQGITWETGTNPWAKSITNAANAIYAIDQTKLIFIEGTAQANLESNWGDGFATDNAAVNQGISNPKKYFTQLLTQPYLNQIVIEPHIYGPDGTNNQGPDHSDQTKAFAAWSRLHGYLLNNFLNVNNTSQSGFCSGGNCHLFAIAIGEFGGSFDPADPYYTKDVATQINLAKYITRLGLNKPALPSWFYWDLNPNSGNTGGILKNDWKTIDCNKVNYLKQYLQLKPAAGICP